MNSLQVTEFTPAQEEICEENFEKKCQITFKSMAVTETLKKCYRPLMKTCGNEATPSRLRFKRQQQTKRWNHHGGPVLSRAKRQLAGKPFLHSFSIKSAIVHSLFLKVSKFQKQIIFFSFTTKMNELILLVLPQPQSTMDRIKKIKELFQIVREYSI